MKLRAAHSGSLDLKAIQIGVIIPRLKPRSRTSVCLRHQGVRHFSMATSATTDCTGSQPGYQPRYIDVCVGKISFSHGMKLTDGLSSKRLESTLQIPSSEAGIMARNGILTT
jgi:hypothetical protein